MPTREMAFVLNGQAGALLGQNDAIGSLQALLGGTGATVHTVPLDAGTLPERVAIAKDSGADIIVVAGGDGSLACAATELLGSTLTLGVIPSGTMNLLARDLHIDPADHDSAVRLLAEGSTRSIDAGLVGDHVFLCASMLGTPARLSRHREAGRRNGNGLAAWIGFGYAALRALLRNRSMWVVLSCNGQVLRRRTPSITITVNRLDDATGRRFGRSNLSGGELAVYVVRRSSALRQMLLLLRTAITGQLREPDVEIFTTTDLRVGSIGSALHVLVDGELRLMKPPLHYVLRPGALRVIAPR